MLTLPREGRSATIMRCTCGAQLHLPDAPPQRGEDAAETLAEQTAPARSSLPAARAREIQAELAGHIWR